MANEAPTTAFDTCHDVIHNSLLIEREILEIRVKLATYNTNDTENMHLQNESSLKRNYVHVTFYIVSFLYSCEDIITIIRLENVCNISQRYD